MNERPQRILISIAIGILAVSITVLLASNVYPLFFPSDPEPSTEPVILSTEPSEPSETTEPPQPEYFTLTFAGNLVPADAADSTEENSFSAMVGANYSWPLEKLQSVFMDDDYTFLNLDAPLTDSDTPKGKDAIRGKLDYVKLLSQSGIDFANVANDYTLDYGQIGYDNTVSALSDAGIRYANSQGTALVTTPSGLTIGIYAENQPRSSKNFQTIFDQLRTMGAELIVVSMHWGQENSYTTNPTQEKLAHAAIDAGADIIFGHHPQVLQKIEQYNGKVIFYSLGTLSSGLQTELSDPDTAVLQQQVVREPDGTIRLGKLDIIPCARSGGANDLENDFQPQPLEITRGENSAYDRVLQKLEGTYKKPSDQTPEETTAPTTEPTGPATTEPSETTPGTEPDTTEPSETTPDSGGNAAAPTETNP